MPFEKHELTVLAGVDKALAGLSACRGWGVLKNPEYRTALIMIACHESWFGKVNKQIKGPALSAFMIEPRTYNDIQNNVVWANDQLRAALRNIYGIKTIMSLETDVGYAAACAALQVGRFRNIEPLPKTDKEIAVWLKKRYNSAGGKATAEEYLNDYNRLYKNRT